MRIAIIGQQAFGKAVLDAFLERGDDVAAVFCAPEKPGARPDPLRLEAETRGLTLHQLPSLKGPEAAAAMREAEVELCIMAYVLQFAPEALLDIPAHGTIQYHPSLLPRYRGPSSINWPIINGETETGLTVFRPSDGLDEGPVVLQKTTPIGPDDTLGSVYFDRLFPMGVKAVLEAADLVVTGRHQEIVQDERHATYEGWCRDPEARINWSAHASAAHNLIRGCDPSPGAWTLSQGRKIRLYGSRLHLTRRFADVAGKPGEICAIGNESLTIALQGGAVEIFKVRAEDGRKLAAAAFAAETGLEVGMRLDLDAPPPQTSVPAGPRVLESVTT